MWTWGNWKQMQGNNAIKQNGRLEGMKRNMSALIDLKKLSQLAYSRKGAWFSSFGINYIKSSGKKRKDGEIRSLCKEGKDSAQIHIKKQTDLILIQDLTL